MAEKYICLDKHGNPITKFIFNDDGTVNGIIQNTDNYTIPDSSYGANVYSPTSTAELTKECCERFNFIYDDIDGKCYYDKSCWNPDNNDNSEISSEISEINDRILEIKNELSSLSSKNSEYLSLSNELLQLENNLDSYQSELSPNNVKLLFGVNNNQPILFNVDNYESGDISEESCKENIISLRQAIADVNNQIIQNTNTINNILSNDSTTNQPSALQVSILETSIEILEVQMSEYETELSEIEAICNPAPPPCNLNIEFDYLWNFDCEELLTCSQGDNSLISHLNNQYEVCVETSNSLNNEINTLNSRIIEISTEISNDQENLVNLEAQLEGNTDTLNVYQIENEIDNIRNNLTQLTQEYIDLNNQLTELKPELETQQEVCNQLQIQINNIQTNGSLIGSLEGVTFYLTIEKRYFNEETDLYDWETVYKEPFFNIDNFINHITDNSQTGIYFTGDKCDELIENIGVQLGENCDIISNNTFNSQWLHQSTTINNSTTYNGDNVINSIVDEYIKFGIEIEYDSSNCEYCLLLDNIEMNQTCETMEKTEILVNRCPGFDMKRVVDNKKSWVNIDSGHTRNFDLIERETDYKTINHKAVVNSKEIDLGVEPAHAIELDVYSYSNNNICVLSGTTGQTNYLDYLTTDIEEINNVDTFNYVINSELIDAKSRKVISSYPILRDIYNRYLSPMNYGCTGTTSNSYNYCDLINYTRLLDTFWVDIIEQVIPSTTIWGSVYRYSNTLFDTNKFKYKKNTLDYCEVRKNACEFNGGETFNSNIIIEDLSSDTQTDYPECFIASKNKKQCNYIKTWDYNNSCEYLGKINIINPSGDDINNNINDGNTVVLQEDIDYNTN